MVETKPLSPAELVGKHTTWSAHTWVDRRAHRHGSRATRRAQGLLRALLPGLRPEAAAAERRGNDARWALHGEGPPIRPVRLAPASRPPAPVVKRRIPAAPGLAPGAGPLGDPLWLSQSDALTAVCSLMHTPP